MTYEESVHLEALQKAANLAYRPWIKAETAALTTGIGVWFLLRWIADLSKLELALIAIIAFIAVWTVVSRLEERFTIIYQREFHKLYNADHTDQV